MSGSHVDLAIIGGGPAGVSSAIVAARGGLKVRLFTTRRRRDRPGLESLHPGVASALRALGAEGAIAQSSIGTYTGICINGEFQSFGADGEGPWRGVHVDRARFDAALLQAARRCGVELIEEAATAVRVKDEGVNVEASGSSFSSSFVIDASGRRLVGRWLAFLEITDSAPLMSWSGIDHGASAEEPTFDCSGDGWIWRASAGGSTSWVRVSRADDAAARDPASHAVEVTWRVFRPAARGCVLLTGDAACALDPGRGHGVLQALTSGAQAARTVLRCHESPHLRAWHVTAYDQWLLHEHQSRVAQLRQAYRKLGLPFFNESSIGGGQR